MRLFDYLLRMANRRSLLDVCHHLPSFDGPDFSVEKADPSFQLKAVSPPGYVWPDVQVEGNPAEHHVVLVTAPGAMGKSAASLAIAHLLNAPRVDLADLRVGSSTLTGLLTRVLGWTETPRFIDQLRSGNAALVMDSLDEARLSAGQDHFVAFLQNVAEIIEGASPAGQVVIFGRHDAFETASIAFEVAGLSVCRASIAPLSHQQSCELIDLRLDLRDVESGRPYAIHRIHSEPFGRMRDEVFVDIAEALGHQAVELSRDWPLVESFLGYPPVLLVLSERLAVENPSSAEARVATRLNVLNISPSVQRGQLLRQVVEGILDREAGKVREQVGRTLAFSADETRLLYTREEQALRIVGLTSGVPIEIIPPAGIDSEKRNMYEQLVSTFVLDHPFLYMGKFANVVFSDYVRAYVASSPVQGVHGVPPAQLLASCPHPGPFFALFVHALCLPLSSLQSELQASAPSSDQALVSTEDLVNDLIRSHNAASRGFSTAVFVHQAEVCSLALIEGFFNLPGAANVAPGFAQLEFRIAEPTGVLELTSPISHFVVMSDHGTVINAANNEVEFGPAAAIFSRELEIGGGVFNAFGREFGKNVIFSSKVEHEPALRVKAYPPDSLEVRWPSIWHQWQPFAGKMDLVGHRVNPELSWRVTISIRRILAAFRGSVQADPSIYYEMLDKLIVGTNSVFVAVLAGLKEIEVVQRDGSLYRLRLDVLRKYRVSWADISGPDFAHALKGLRTDLLATKPLQALVNEWGR
ncbi:hypothetical protein ABUL04_00145 [Micromonospora harpali]|uniref:Uncharacterized protein n=1 Tax=Micromonospora harpali TaxID=1490225 RepID=A0ABW1HMV3_9ACTN